METVDDLARKHRREFRRRRASVIPLLLDMVQAIAIARGDRPFYVQVGAHDGVHADPMYERAKSGIWSGLLLEPSSIYFDKLKDVHTDRPDMLVRHLGVSARKATLDLFHVEPEFQHHYPTGITGCASLDRGTLLKHMVSHHDAAGDHIRAERVQLEPLRTILTRERVKKADFLVVDVEGHETEVFRSFSLGKLAPLMVMFEHKHLSSDDYSALIETFNAAGYVNMRITQDTISLHGSLATPGLMAALELMGANVLDRD